LELLDWTARELKSNARGQTPPGSSPLFERLGMNAATWCSVVQDFGRLFYVMAGKPHVIDGQTSRDGKRHYKVKPNTRKLMSAA
jgi:hypothetical protein